MIAMVRQVQASESVAAIQRRRAEARSQRQAGAQQAQPRPVKQLSSADNGSGAPSWQQLILYFSAVCAEVISAVVPRTACLDCCP